MEIERLKGATRVWQRKAGRADPVFFSDPTLQPLLDIGSLWISTRVLSEPVVRERGGKITCVLCQTIRLLQLQLFLNYWVFF